MEVRGNPSNSFQIKTIHHVPNFMTAYQSLLRYFTKNSKSQTSGSTKGNLHNQQASSSWDHDIRSIYPILSKIAWLQTVNLPWNNFLDHPRSPGKVPCWLCVDCVKKDCWLKILFTGGGNLNNPLKKKKRKKEKQGCISHNLWLILLWPACGTVTGFCSRFLLEEAQCPSIDWEAAAGQSVAVCPGAEGCFCVCFCASVCAHLLFSSHTEPLLWCFWHCAVTFDWGPLPVPPSGSLSWELKKKDRWEKKLNCFSCKGSYRVIVWGGQNLQKC